MMTMAIKMKTFVQYELVSSEKVDNLEQQFFEVLSAGVH
jgi:hypothetical protein